VGRAHRIARLGLGKLVMRSANWILVGGFGMRTAGLAITVAAMLLGAEIERSRDANW